MTSAPAGLQRLRRQGNSLAARLQGDATSANRDARPDGDPRRIRARQPLKGARIAGSLHMRSRPAVLIETLKRSALRACVEQHLLDPDQRRVAIAAAATRCSPTRARREGILTTPPGCSTCTAAAFQTYPRTTRDATMLVHYASSRETRRRVPRQAVVRVGGDSFFALIKRLLKEEARRPVRPCCTSTAATRGTTTACTASTRPRAATTAVPRRTSQRLVTKSSSTTLRCRDRW